VMAEASHLQQLFLNLVINATHAIEDLKAKGTPSRALKQPEDPHFIEISAAPGKDASVCEILVRDSGCGIPPANLKKLFQPFFTTKAAGVGTGMGLAIVSKLVDEMKGRVSAESEGPGHGATFKLEFQFAKKSR
jgi:two-component system, NtrC family, sensor kinase